METPGHLPEPQITRPATWGERETQLPCKPTAICSSLGRTIAGQRNLRPQFRPTPASPLLSRRLHKARRTRGAIGRFQFIAVTWHGCREILITPIAPVERRAYLQSLFPPEKDSHSLSCLLQRRGFRRGSRRGRGGRKSGCKSYTRRAGYAANGYSEVMRRDRHENENVPNFRETVFMDEVAGTDASRSPSSVDGLVVV